MARHKRQLTQEQIDWRNSILRTKMRSVKKAEIIPIQDISREDKIRKCFYFLNNCVYWINEYIDGNIDEDRLLKTAKAIQGNARDLENILKTEVK